MMDVSTLRELGRLQSLAQRFGVVYHQPLVRNCSPSGPPPISRCLVVPRVSSRRPTSPRSDLKECLHLAHEALQFGSIYRTPSRAPYVGSSPRPRRRTPRDAWNDYLCTNEVNRLARLCELSSDVTGFYPVYTPHYDLTVKSNRLRLRSLLSLDADFAAAFPGTSLPRPRLFSGLPRVSRETFSFLLKTKLQQARTCLRVTISPKGVVPLVIQWINSVLRSLVRLPTSSANKQNQPQRAQRTRSSIRPGLGSVDFLSSRFVPARAADSSPTPPGSPVMSAHTSRASSVSSRHRLLRWDSSLSIPDNSSLNAVPPVPDSFDSAATARSVSNRLRTFGPALDYLQVISPYAEHQSRDLIRLDLFTEADGTRVGACAPLDYQNPLVLDALDVVLHGYPDLKGYCSLGPDPDFPRLIVPQAAMSFLATKLF
jgi:hypothetical protein